MSNKFLSIALLMATLASSPATFAQASMHTEHTFAFGRPAREADVTKTIRVEATDQMRLNFDSMNIRRGDVVKFVIKNAGRVPHEFAIGDEAFRRDHMKEMRHEMANMAGMQHDPNAVSLQPGETGTLIWRFEPLQTRDVMFACFVLGHYEAGMYRRYVIPQ